MKILARFKLDPHEGIEPSLQYYQYCLLTVNTNEAFYLLTVVCPPVTFHLGISAYTSKVIGSDMEQDFFHKPFWNSWNLIYTDTDKLVGMAGLEPALIQLCANCFEDNANTYPLKSGAHAQSRTEN